MGMSLGLNFIYMLVDTSFSVSEKLKAQEKCQNLLRIRPYNTRAPEYA